VRLARPDRASVLVARRAIAVAFDVELAGEAIERRVAARMLDLAMADVAIGLDRVDHRHGRFLARRKHAFGEIAVVQAAGDAPRAFHRIAVAVTVPVTPEAPAAGAVAEPAGALPRSRPVRSSVVSGRPDPGLGCGHHRRRRNDRRSGRRDDLRGLVAPVFARRLVLGSRLARVRMLGRLLRGRRRRRFIEVERDQRHLLLHRPLDSQPEHQQRADQRDDRQRHRGRNRAWRVPGVHAAKADRHLMHAN